MTVETARLMMRVLVISPDQALADFLKRDLSAAEFEVLPRWIGVYRFDAVDPDRDETEDAVRAHTVSSAFRADDHLYLTGEYAGCVGGRTRGTGSSSSTPASPIDRRFPWR